MSHRARPGTARTAGRRPSTGAPGGNGRRSGQSLVEFALVLPILLLIVVALFDVGMYVFAANDITNAARKGVRVAIVDQTSGAAANAAIEQATGLGLTTADVSVAFYSAEDLSKQCAPVQVNCIAEVTVSYEWEPIAKSVLLLGLIFPDPITLSTTSRMPVERTYP